MAKSRPATRRPGRPPKDVQLDEKIMVRFDTPTREALDEYARTSGAGAAAVAVRMIVTEKLRGEGLLK